MYHLEGLYGLERTETKAMNGEVERTMEEVIKGYFMSVPMNA
jgi:hypothetical protein